ncbi:hypothetical protein JRO89_XS10G0177600 [Xanthoceras sorbifolium]|uniref:C2H2-type domain-containing protein n=1 Tax=Xanthoceras sorbifolium TaxID=99658 RepID=A0ABQ8HJE8_9ROSI|nr:hypothetical protein JRO89_XS10G0177600 [Xanthoceras sorbifolium]
MELVMMGSNDHNQIVKGKRTKRQRSLSPFGVAAAVTSGSSSSSGYGGGGGGEGVMDDYCCYNSVSSTSPTTSGGGGGEIYESTEEEEDMANCLIMLAQGDAAARRRRHHHHQIEESFKTEEKLNTSRPKYFSGTVTASTTTGTTATTNKAAGFYVYECKTCNRCFPSFQALGGHRASHKKPKATAAAAEDHQKKSSSMVFPPLKDDFDDATPPPPLQAAAAATITTTNKASKIHECSICGSEFTSGQALGGHMRRHRAAANINNQVVVMSTTANVDTTATAIIDQSGHDDDHSISHRSNNLPLDLNLPAPEDDHLRDSKFQFGSSTQQAHTLVFSAPALVDCHY